MAALRLTKPRLDFLVLIHRYNGTARNSHGRLRTELAEALGHTAAPATLRRILADLEQAGMITTDARNGRLYEVRLEGPGRRILEARGLIPNEPRRYLLDPAHAENRSHMTALIASAIANLERYARSHEFPDDPDQARLEANYALHADLTPRLPDTAELSVEISNLRATITELGDSYVRSPTSVDAATIDTAVHQLQELRLMLIAARFAIEHPLPDLETRPTTPVDTPGGSAPLTADVEDTEMH